MAGGDDRSEQLNGERKLNELHLSELRFARGRARGAIAAMGVALLVACGNAPTKREVLSAEQERRNRGVAVWKTRCAKSGVFIHKTIENIEGIYLVNVRIRLNYGESPEDQFALDDPYGHDSVGDNYILNFLQGFYYRSAETKPRIPGAPPRIGYRYVEAVDPKDGKLYRFTGGLERSKGVDGRNSSEHVHMFLERKLIDKRSARFGVKFEDISSREDRSYWIAGSSLKVLDLETGEVVAERVGYMVDRAQGSRAGNRSPWLFAADSACPDFHRNPNSTIRNGAAAQMGQTLDFVEQVLKPKTGRVSK